MREVEAINEWVAVEIDEPERKPKVKEEPEEV